MPKTSSLAAWLVENPIRSFSPQTGMLLIGIAHDIRKALASSKKLDPETRAEAEKYADELYSVARTAGDQQGTVIAKLSNLLGDPPPAWIKEK